MKIRAAVLCDYATVREGLLTVVSAGVSRVGVPVFPCPFTLCVAVMLEIPPDKVDKRHELRVTIAMPSSAEKLAELAAEFKANGTGQPGEPALAPFAFDLRMLPIPGPGQYDIRIVAERETELLSVWFGQVSQPES